ncbi:MAG: lytic transglycosylase domain-containing protein [Candidatus Riflebacteria bacterium]|nr:lytic transglycosylase domain-containing protein [Candidatus Riflebacteria bacterium]
MPDNPGGKSVTTRTPTFANWFSEAMKYANYWEFPQVYNKCKELISREDYFKAIILIESEGIHTFKSGKVKKSCAGAMGFTQLMAATARGLRVDPKDPRQNLLGGVKYLTEIFSSKHITNISSGEEKLVMAACAYNLGPFSKSLKSTWDEFKLKKGLIEPITYGLKIKMCLGLELTETEKNLVINYLSPEAGVNNLADNYYKRAKGIKE